MKYLIDTSSLFSLLRYFLPFDVAEVLYACVQQNFAAGKFVLVNNVRREITRTAQGIVVKQMPFLQKTRTLSAPVMSDKTHNKLDNNWLNGQDKNRLIEKSGEAGYEVMKEKFLQTGDAALILCALTDRENCTVVTEESAADNDGKLFKKIPVICRQEKIPCITLPQLLKALGVRIKYDV